MATQTPSVPDPYAPPLDASPPHAGVAPPPYGSGPVGVSYGPSTTDGSASSFGPAPAAGPAVPLGGPTTFGPAPAYGPAPTYGPSTTYGPTPSGSRPPERWPLDGAPQRTGWALAALLVGIGSLVLGVPVSVGTLGVLGGLVGVVLGVVALRRVRAGATGTGMAVIGIVTSSVAAVVGALVAVNALPTVVEGVRAGAERAQTEATASSDAIEDAYQEGWDDGYVEGQAAATAPRDVSGLSPTDAEIEQAALGEAVRVGRYTVAVTDVRLDADDAVAQADPRNPGAVGRYVQATLRVTNDGPHVGRPLLDLLASYWAEDDWLYDEYGCPAYTARPTVDVGALAVGETAEYEVCFDVPEGEIAATAVLVEDLAGPAYTMVRWSTDGPRSS